MKDFNPKQPLFLCGMMASGKSTIGRKVAEMLKVPFTDLDSRIEQATGKTIPEIFQDEGEEAFRVLERKQLIELVKEAEGVVALGGGSLQNQMLVDHVKLYGWLIFINTPLSDIVNRLYQKKGRPMVESLNREALQHRIEHLFEERLAFYQQSPITVNTKNKSAEESAEEIIQKLKVYEG